MGSSGSRRSKTCKKCTPRGRGMPISFLRVSGVCLKRFDSPWNRTRYVACFFLGGGKSQAAHHTYVCMCVCVYVCMYILYLCIYVYMYVCIYVYTYVYINIYTYIYMLCVEAGGMTHDMLYSKARHALLETSEIDRVYRQR